MAAAPACSIGSRVSAPRPLNRTAAGLLPGIGLGQIDVGEIDCDDDAVDILRRQVPIGSMAGAAAGMICCGFAIQPPPCNGRRTLNGNAAPDPGGKNVQPGDVFAQVPTPVTAEFRDIRTWANLHDERSGLYLYADFRIVTEGAPHRSASSPELGNSARRTALRIWHQH